MSKAAPRAILLPSYQWNPYQRLLAEAVSEAGFQASAVHEWPRRTPLLGAWLLYRLNRKPGAVQVTDKLVGQPLAQK